MSGQRGLTRVVGDAVQPGEDTEHPPQPDTPLRKLGRMTADDVCEHCNRFTEPDPDDLAAQLGVSASTVRRLADPEFVPSMPTVAKIAAAVGWSPIGLMELLWPHLGMVPADVPDDDTVTEGAADAAEA